jgi:hypothetical protein
MATPSFTSTAPGQELASAYFGIHFYEARFFVVHKRHLPSLRCEDDSEGHGVVAR